MYRKENFEIAGADGYPILGDLTYGSGHSEHIVIFVHGFKGFKDWGTHHQVAEYFAARELNFIKFNFSHSGVNAGNPSDVTDLELFAKNTPTKELFDLEKVISFTKNKFPSQKIVLIGHSRGGAISILQSVKDKRISKLITWAAIGNFRDLWDIKKEVEWRKTGTLYILNGRTKQQMPLDISLLDDVFENNDAFNLNDAAKRIFKPWLIVQGDEDTAVKVETAEKFHQDQPQESRLMIVKGGNHVFGASHPYEKEELPEDLEKVCKACVDFIRTEK